MKTARKTFQCAGHSFQGIRRFKDVSITEILDNLQGAVMPKDSTGWDYGRFLDMAAAAGADTMDIFLMDGKYEVMPSKENIFLYGAESAWLYDRDNLPPA